MSDILKNYAERVISSRSRDWESEKKVEGCAEYKHPQRQTSTKDSPACTGGANSRERLSRITG